MRQFRFVQYDVFTDVPFGGNQLAVILDAGDLTSEEMQKIAQEMNYSETTFVLPATDVKAVRKVRIFTTGSEMPFAGHPVIGTTFALAHDKAVRSGDTLPIYLELGIGSLPLDLLFEGDDLSFVWMHQPTPEFVPWEGDRERLMAAFGLSAEDLAPELPIETGSSGAPFTYVPLRSLAALQRAVPGNSALVDALTDSGDPRNAYLFSVEPVESDGTTRRSRMFSPSMGSGEDAATGSAAGPFAAYLLRHYQILPDRYGEVRFNIQQGVEMGRPSLIKVALTCESGAEHPAHAVRDVRVGGEAVLVAEGTIVLP